MPVSISFHSAQTLIIFNRYECSSDSLRLSILLRCIKIPLPLIFVMQWSMVLIVRTGVSDGRFFHDAEGKSWRKHGQNKTWNKYFNFTQVVLNVPLEIYTQNHIYYGKKTITSTSFLTKQNLILIFICGLINNAASQTILCWTVWSLVNDELWRTWEGMAYLGCYPGTCLERLTNRIVGAPVGIQTQHLPCTRQVHHHLRPLQIWLTVQV
jgi:hypothetical protein